MGITLALYSTWVEQQNTGAVGPRWGETLVCHMHQSSKEICLLCCNRADGTLESQDSGKEQQGSHGNADDLLTLGKQGWQNIASGKALRSLDEVGILKKNHLYNRLSGTILHYVCLRPKGAAFGPARFDLT